ncbi:transcriptional regulator, TraR/DksA family [Thermomonospora echinospora]|uniref:Transcriptional regulator, TraR/DksA family n=1 Tax=Thermomonospora echinospora TaxID=1992 RepID=A0A1H6CX77_9ACTN|nr:TraR/DksA C4-type zinc finger protein [Thermomonospora echinospora]SEG77105.1 transcriptional regulator, TraR/DksA family [Thermomonospora echinospora]
MATDAPGRLSSVQLQALRERIEADLSWRAIRLDQLVTRLREDPLSGTERPGLLAEVIAAETHLAELRRALERIGEGDFGRCERCGDPIGYALLKLRPLTSRCATCR